MSQTVTRFPPSPTGYLHIGRARTALFNYLYARKNAGKFLFRIEDTDKERSKKEYEENIVECLGWLGIKYDNDPPRQSERNHIYIGYLKKLVDSGLAYVSQEDPDKEGLSEEQKGKDRRTEVIRFKNPNKKISFTDLIRGEIEFDTTDLGDFVIAKSMEEPLYHLAVVIDDHEMGVTHVIRGDDGISNTPRQILIQEGIGAARPVYAHVPLILAKDRSKLSGRHGAVAVSEYRNKGYLPEAFVNYLALLGWHPASDKEIFSVDELIAEFDLERVQKSGAIFDEEKLRWFNRQYILKLSDEDLTERAASFVPEWISVKSPLWKRLLPVVREKISVLYDVADIFAVQGELHFVKGISGYAPGMLLWKKNPSKEASSTHIRAVRDILEKIDSSGFTAEAIKAAVWSYAEEQGRGDVLWPMRTALTAQEKSPDPFLSAAILGREESLRRLDLALTELTNSNS